jgi:hypothetical protein
VELLLVGLLALALGIVVGLVVGARRRVNLVLSGGVLQGAGIARILPSDMPRRLPGDLLAGRILIALGDQVYQVPTLARGPARRWLEQMDLRFAALVSGLDDAAAVPEILALLESETEAMLDQLIAYDVTGVLPDRATIDEQASDAQILRAVLEVWRAVHPLAGTLAAAVSGTSGTSFVPPSSPLASTAGPPPTSIG